MYANKWVKYKGTYYYLGGDGAMYTNRWVKYGGSYYYLGADGAPYANGTHTIEGGKARFDGSARFVEGWAKSGSWYYLKRNGKWASNEWVRTLEGWNCFFAKSGTYQKCK